MKNKIKYNFTFANYARELIRDFIFNVNFPRTPLRTDTDTNSNFVNRYNPPYRSPQCFVGSTETTLKTIIIIFFFIYT